MYWRFIRRPQRPLSLFDFLYLRRRKWDGAYDPAGLLSTLPTVVRWSESGNGGNSHSVSPIYSEMEELIPLNGARKLLKKLFDSASAAEYGGNHNGPKS
jgi:hypothetical protein